jgi:peroxiredoxin
LRGVDPRFAFREVPLALDGDEHGRGSAWTDRADFTRHSASPTCTAAATRYRGRRASRLDQWNCGTLARRSQEGRRADAAAGVRSAPSSPHRTAMSETIAAPPRVGDSAPDFTLTSTSGQPVTLSSYRGSKHVLLAFFPAAFTGVCTTEVCAFSEDFDAFSGRDVQVLPISVDNVPSLKEFKAKYDLKVDLLSDFKREVSRAYGTLIEQAFLSNRAYFLIDKAGVVRWAHIEEHPGHRRENAEILAEIAKVAG